MEYTDRPNRDAVRYGEDINSHYINKFIPSLEADARLTAQEIGESGRFNLNRFVGKIPELGDVKELTEHYMGEVKKAA
jgi:type II secretory pathway component PulK